MFFNMVPWPLEPTTLIPAGQTRHCTTQHNTTQRRGNTTTIAPSPLPPPPAPPFTHNFTFRLFLCTTTASVEQGGLLLISIGANARTTSGAGTAGQTTGGCVSTAIVADATGAAAGCGSRVCSVQFIGRSPHGASAFWLGLPLFRSAAEAAECSRQTSPSVSSTAGAAGAGPS